MQMDEPIFNDEYDDEHYQERYKQPSFFNLADIMCDAAESERVNRPYDKQLSNTVFWMTGMCPLLWLGGGLIAAVIMPAFSPAYWG